MDKLTPKEYWTKLKERNTNRRKPTKKLGLIDGIWNEEHDINNYI